MLRNLPAFILLIFFFTAANAQTQADSVASHAPVDTLVKHPVADSTVKRTAVDSTIKQISADSAIKRPPADSISAKPTINAIIKQPATDSVAKHAVIDSAALHPITENMLKRTSKNAPPKSPVVAPPVVIHSPVKTLTDKQYNSYLKGEDMDDMALVGVMNHYPLPDQALKYKVQIGLNPGQITKLKDLSATLHHKKMQMGDNIIRNEKMLDSLFHSKQVEDGTLIFYTNRSGLYLGELRGAILMACYKTEEILSDDQIKKLLALEKVN